MSSLGFNVESINLARLLANGLVFFPARSVVKTGRVRLWPDRLEVTTTDTYAAGTDSCPAEFLGANDPPRAWPVSLELDRDGWRDIEKQARADRGNVGRVEYRAGDCLHFACGDGIRGVAKDVTGKLTTRLVSGDALASESVWALTDAMLERLRGEPTVAPERLTFDPALLGRFGKVRTPDSWGGGKVLDLIYQGPGEPLLAKVGPSFVGAIMPVDRAAYVDAQGPEGQAALW